MVRGRQVLHTSCPLCGRHLSWGDDGGSYLPAHLIGGAEQCVWLMDLVHGADRLESTRRVLVHDVDVNESGTVGVQQGLGQVSVVLAEDHELFAQALKRSLESSGGFVVREVVSSGDTLVDAFRRWRPDLVVTDLSMEPVGGVEAVAAIMSLDASAKVVVLSAFGDRHLVAEAVQAGAVGYLSKTSTGAALVRYLGAAARGEPAFDAAATKVLVANTRGPSDTYGLSVRQIEALELVSRGLTYREIADEMVVGTATVKTHLTEAYTKLGVSGSNAAVRRAIELGVLRTDR
jgi:DNA-binding NarL/FixJ family response regulator